MQLLGNYSLSKVVFVVQIGESEFWVAGLASPVLGREKQEDSLVLTAWQVAGPSEVSEPVSKNEVGSS